GNAKYRPAVRTSPRRRASDHALITLTALAGADTPVGPGLGTGLLGLISGAGVGGEGNLPVTRCVVVWFVRCVLPPQPTASNAIVKTALHEARWTPAVTHAIVGPRASPSIRPADARARKRLRRRPCRASGPARSSARSRG